MRRVLALACALAPAAARGEPLDTFGFGARAAALAGATTAATSGAEAAHANPAAVVLAGHPEIALGWGYESMALRVDGDRAGVLDGHGLDLGIALPHRVGPVDAAFGLALHLPDQFVARVQLVPASEPHFVLLDNDIHRIVVEPVVALRPLTWLAVGGGVSLLADAGGEIRFDVGVAADEKVGESEIDADLPTRAAPHLGVWAWPIPRLQLGATYRGEVDLGVKLDILTDVDIAGGITGDVLISVRAINYFTPQRVTLGAAYDVTEELTVLGELSWFDWSSFDGAAPDVRILVDLDVSPPLVEALFPDEGFHDTIVPRVGAEWRHPFPCYDLAARAGYAFEPSPVPDQVGLTSFADNDRHILALGAGVTVRALEPILTRPVDVDVGLQWHRLAERTVVKDQRLFPGRSFSSEGNIFHGGVTMRVSF